MGNQHLTMVVRVRDYPVHEPRNFKIMKEFKDPHLVVSSECKATCDHFNIRYRDVKSESGEDYLMLAFPESGYMDSIMDTLSRGNVQVFLDTILKI